ncbi:hypothetical protein PybrP1_002913 [[Pythium] brassicae (nom. inval.)]|nr:hypothetical protein PybrP1_002913 [[Pythium] brassicae (nom. inval.)]
MKIRKAAKLTLGGSGRVLKTQQIEDQLLQYAKDPRRDDFTEKSPAACIAWCSRFMKRNALTLRRATHSGLKKRDKLLARKGGFVVNTTVEVIGKEMVPAKNA